MDLRWDWLHDWVSQRMFILPYLRSLLNPADFFTKALPVHRHRHQELPPLFVTYPPLLPPPTSFIYIVTIVWLPILLCLCSAWVPRGLDSR